MISENTIVEGGDAITLDEVVSTKNRKSTDEVMLITLLLFSLLLHLQFFITDCCQRHGLVPRVDSTWWVRFTDGADRIWHIHRVAADSKSASSLRSLPQLLFCAIYLKIISVYWSRHELPFPLFFAFVREPWAYTGIPNSFFIFLFSSLFTLLTRESDQPL